VPSEKRTRIARVVAAHPFASLFLLYEMLFLCCAAAADALSFVLPGPGPNRYLFPLALTVVFWLGLCTWAKRTLRRPAVASE
jgi:hypothetical protein